MKEYKERNYRSLFRNEGRTGFVVAHKKSDLWVGVDKASFTPEMPAFCKVFLEDLWGEMEAYLTRDPGYGASLVPYAARPDAPEIFTAMSAVAKRTGIGPMSAVAGAVALRVGEALKSRFGATEVLVENGGDIYVDVADELTVSVFAGESPLSEKVGWHIVRPRITMGVCTSSGTVGPSLSFGKADAVMVACRDVLLADSYATAFANQVKTVEDVQRVADKMAEVEEILAAIVIKGDRIGMTGEFDLAFF